MHRSRIDLLGWTDFHQLAQVHHADSGGHVAHNGQVMGDEHVGQVVFTLQIPHQVEDLRLHRNI
jgi:hypothetical protein